MKKKFKEKAFTLSEVIITLVVLGIVAAITVPMMSSNAHDKKWNVARQKAKATIGEAFRLMTVNGEITTTNADNTPRTTEYMVTKVLPKYLKLEKTCAPANYSQCGFPSTIKTPSGTTVGLALNNYKWSELSNAYVWKYSPPDGSWNFNNNITTFTSKYGNTYNTSYYFRTLDGFSVAFLYNPYCAVDTKEHSAQFVINNYYHQPALDTLCLMGIYDMNGKKGPNKVGYDIGFIGSFYNGFETRAATALPYTNDVKNTQTGQSGNAWTKLYNYCDKLGKDKEWIMPDLDELSLLYLNYKLIGNGSSNSAGYKHFQSRTPFSPGTHLGVHFLSDRSGYRTTYADTNADDWGPYVRCVRRTHMK